MLLIKLTLILVVCTLIGWAEAAHASEQWDARTTARVNLRKHPRSGGVILSIVPEGQKLRIIEQDGVWYKVDVEGKIHGKGWVHGDYVKKMTPVTASTESAPEDFRPESAAKDHKKVTHSPEMLPAARTIEKTVKPPEKPQAETPAITGADEQFSGGQTLRETKAEAGVLSKIDVPAADGSARLDPAETRLDTRKQIETAGKPDTGDSPKLKTPVAVDPLPLVASKTPAESPVENKRPEPLSLSSSARKPKPALENSAPVPDKLQDAKIEPVILIRPETPGAGKAGLTPPGALPQTPFKKDAHAIGGKDSSKTIEIDVAALDSARFPSTEMKNGTLTQETPIPVEKQAVIGAPQPVSQVESVSTPLERIEPATKTESMAPVRIALKLLSIILSCGVILLLYQENKCRVN